MKKYVIAGLLLGVAIQIVTFTLVAIYPETLIESWAGQITSDIEGWLLWTVIIVYMRFLSPLLASLMLVFVLDRCSLLSKVGFREVLMLVVLSVIPQYAYQFGLLPPATGVVSSNGWVDMYVIYGLVVSVVLTVAVACKKQRFRVNSM